MHVCHFKTPIQDLEKLISVLMLVPYLKPTINHQVFELSRTINLSRGMFLCLAISWKQNVASDRVTVKYLSTNNPEDIKTATFNEQQHFEQFLCTGEYTVQIQVQNPKDITSIRDCSREGKKSRFIYHLFL
jgi:hypothetical protein